MGGFHHWWKCHHCLFETDDKSKRGTICPNCGQEELVHQVTRGTRTKMGDYWGKVKEASN